MSGQNHAAVAVRLGVRNVLGANEIMRNDQMNEAAGMDRVNEESQVKNKSEGLTVSGVKRGLVRGRAADDMVSEKANARVAKEQENDPAVSLVNNVRGANREKANLIAALATRVVHQDQGEKSAIDAAELEAEVEMQETTDANEFVTLRTSRMAT